MNISTIIATMIIVPVMSTNITTMNTNAIIMSTATTIAIVTMSIAMMTIAAVTDIPAPVMAEKTATKSKKIF